MNLIPLSFIDEPIVVTFHTPQLLEKTPVCPDGFTWHAEYFSIVKLLTEWTDFRRRGRMSRNMRPEHAARASQKGSWGVGRFYFRVEVDGGKLFELYYDRAPDDAQDRKGKWFLRYELTNPG